MQFSRDEEILMMLYSPGTRLGLISALREMSEKVASTDAAIVYRYANGKYQLSADQLLAADVNGDGVVNSTDAALIYRMANGKLLKFPVEKEKQSEQATD